MVLKENFDHALANHFKHYNGRDRCVKALCKLLIARSIYVSTTLQKKTLKQIFRKELRWTRYSLRLLYCAFHSLSEISFPFFQSSRLSTCSMGWALHWKPTNSYEKKFILCPLEAYILKWNTNIKIVNYKCDEYYKREIQVLLLTQVDKANREVHRKKVTFQFPASLLLGRSTQILTL